MEVYRQKADQLKGKMPSQERERERYQESAYSDNVSANKQMALTDDDTVVTSAIILDKLGRCNSEHDHDLSSREMMEIPHIRQTKTWDCGLACVQMILEWFRQSSEINGLHHDSGNEGIISVKKSGDQRIVEKAWMEEFVATESIWTIDLVILLEYILSGATKMAANKSIDQVQGKINEGDYSFNGQQRNCLHPLGLVKPLQSPPLPFLFCSTNFGVDESYNSLGYYKDAFSSDELRVKNLFNKARGKCLPLLETSHLSLDVLVDVVSRDCIVAIVLLDNRVLGHSDVSIECYSGHYVILCGISSDDDDVKYAQINAAQENEVRPKICMVVKNPASLKQVEFITPALFEKAWRAKGTDEDVIFLAKNAISQIKP